MHCTISSPATSLWRTLNSSLGDYIARCDKWTSCTRENVHPEKYVRYASVCGFWKSVMKLKGTVRRERESNFRNAHFCALVKPYDELERRTEKMVSVEKLYHNRPVQFSSSVVMIHTTNVQLTHSRLTAERKCVRFCTRLFDLILPYINAMAVAITIK